MRRGRGVAAWLLPVLIATSAVATVNAADLAPASRATPARITGAPNNGRILFTHCDAGGCHIYTANPDGSAVERVTHAGDAVMGDWSPDGRHIAYVGFVSGDAAIWIIDADGRHPRQLTPNDPRSDNLWPRYSADGAWILFTNCAGDDCDGGLSAIRPDGTGAHRITPNSHRSYNDGSRSPDGTRLAYMRWHVGGVKMAVYVSGRRGEDQRRVTPPRLEGWAPSWAPSGHRLVFASYVFGDRPAPSLYTVDPDGSHLTALTHPPYPHSDVWPAYSPDGRKVVFQSDRRHGDFCCSDLFVTSAHGGQAHRVRLPFDAYEPRWGTAPVMPARPTRDQRSSVTGTTGGPPCTHVPALVAVEQCAGPAEGGGRPSGDG